MRKHSLLSLLLAAVLAFSVISPAALADEIPAEEEPSSPQDYLGKAMHDFTVETISGRTFTLSEELKEKKAVLINFWATWCDPCRTEFPFLEEAYQQYKDDVTVLALSIEKEDTPEVLKEYAESMGMTFDVGSDADRDLTNLFVDVGIPTSVAIDRFGNIVLIKVNSQTSADPFLNLFAYLCADDYTETKVLNNYPPVRPTVKPVSPEELAAALNAEGAPITWSNPTSDFTWPMIPVEEEKEKPEDKEESPATVEAEPETAEVKESESGAAELETKAPESTDGKEEQPKEEAVNEAAVPAPKTFVTNTNQYVNGSTASVTASFQTKEGDVLAFDFRTSTELSCDIFVIATDEDFGKMFSGSHDWTSYAVPFEKEGEHSVTFYYVKDTESFDGDDQIWFGNVRILSGKEAENALESNIRYLHAEETTLTILNEGAREIEFEGSEEDMAVFRQSIPIETAYILSDTTVKAKFTVDSSIEVEAASIYNDFDGSMSALLTLLKDDGYYYESEIDSMETSKYPFSAIYLIMDPITVQNLSWLLFADEDNAEIFGFLLAMNGIKVSWKYVDVEEPEAEPELPGKKGGKGAAHTSKYTVTFTDQNGDPVPGCIINFCTDTTCLPVVANENGIATFEGEAYAYHLQVIKVPKGYTFDTSKEFYADPDGGEMSIQVTKD